MTQQPAPGAERHAAHDFRQRLMARWPTTRRRQVVIVVALLAIFVATFIASSRLLRFVFEDLDVLAYVGLFLACWIGAGGGLVPVPGVRAISWVMIVQQGAALDPVTVALVAAFAMVLGQSSYFLATRATRRRLAEDAPSEHEDELAPHVESPTSPELSKTPAPVDPRPPPHGDEEAAAESRRARAMAAARRRITDQVQHHGIATVFVVCALPTPLTTLTTTAAAASGMRYPRFFVAGLGGFLLLSSILVIFGQGLVIAFQSMLPH